ncbi:TfpX/TfpZ family type IV pilin accessory protein [Acinetobacter sp. ANC 3781]
MISGSVSLQERFKAFLGHLIFSVFLLLISLVFIFYIWYPGALKHATGVLTVYAILLFVDLILGPLLTAFVYKKDKIKFIFDMVIILIIQVSAFLFGLYTLEKGRPAWLVFVVDDFEIISKSQLQPNVKIPEQFQVHFWEKPQWIAATYSDDPVIRKQQKEDEIFDGISLTTRPESYRALNTKYSVILNKAKPMDELRRYNTIDSSEKSILNKANHWLPLKAPEMDMVVLLDKTGQPTKIVNLRPW